MMFERERNDLRRNFKVRPIVGLESGQVSGFNCSPDGSALSILFDDASVANPPVESTEPREDKTRVLCFRMVMGNNRAKMRFDLRGFRNDPDKPHTKFWLKLGARWFDLSALMTSETYAVRVERLVQSTYLDVVVEMTAMNIPEQYTQITLDSIDIAMLRPHHLIAAPYSI